jgi:hypothetical protein
MDNKIPDLLRIVREEIGVYSDLVEHARRKTTLLVQGRLDALLESNKIEENFNYRLRVLETEMSHLCSDLCQSFRIPREEFTLLKLADGVEQSVAAEIKSQASLFKTIVEQLKSVNQRNRKLIERSIHYSRGLMDFLSNVTSSYQETGLFRPLPTAQTTYSHRA